METVLWIVQALLALAFAGAGLAKLTQPREKLAARMAFVEDMPTSQVRLIGALELAGALGLILPMLLNIYPVLTPLAGLGLVLVMIGAAFTHVRRQEYPLILPNIVLGALAVLVFYGRFIAVPVA